MKIQNAFPVFGHLATVWTSRLTAFAYLPSSSQVGGQVWSGRARASLLISPWHAENNWHAFDNYAFNNMSCHCHALISRLSVAPHLSAATMCPTKHFPEHSHPDIYHAFFLLLKSPAHISSAHMIQHCWVGVKGSSHVSALSKTQPAPEMLPCAPSMCTKYVN